MMIQENCIMITGGAGFIGSHTCVELLQSGYRVVVVDNLINSTAVSLDRVKEITGEELVFCNIDIRDKTALRSVFSEHNIHAVIHFAGLKAVKESAEQPLDYYDNNVGGSVALFEVMIEANIKTLILSSSATVYGEPLSVPIKEDFPVSPTNPYGRTKLIIEEILRDVHRGDPKWRVGLLRYFNPVGAHSSGRIGENPNGIPNNLMPYISQVAVGRLEELLIFGNDYLTRDGTGVRDYIHVTDLARGHLAALRTLMSNDSRFKDGGILTVNLGTGTGYSVLELVKAFENVSGVDIPHKIVDRRAGDISECYADPSYAKQVLGWEAELGLGQMCEDAWRWQSCNPSGFRES